MIEVTKELILSLKSDRGGYTKASLKKIGVPWPLKTGWKQRVIGTFVPDFRENQKLTFIPELKSESESGLTFRFEMTAFQITEKPTAKSAKSQKPDHFPDVRNKVDDEKLESLWQKGSKAWIDVHNPAEWVETMRTDETWDSLYEKGGHEWITEHTPHTRLENDPENPPWKEL